MMRSLVCTAPRRLEYMEAPAPVLSAGQAIIRIKRIGICGTDLHAYEGTQPFFAYPRILGHELAADLIEFDQALIENDMRLKPGEPVSIIPYFACGVCIACRNGRPNCCVHLKVSGVHIDGGMVDYLSVPVNSLIKAQGLGYDELAFLEPLSIGAHAVRRGSIQPGEIVLVSGAGPIGLAAMEFARLAGAKVIALDTAPNRINFVRKNQKAEYVFDATSADLEERIKEITHGDFPSVVMDATGNRDAINHAFRYLAHGGRYILIGLQKGDITINHPEFHKREATLMSSRNATRTDFVQVIGCIIKGMIRVADFISHTLPFEKVKDDFGSWLDPRSGVIKVMIKMD
jgi:2-desacetyl-2-hydroxyethyl bacteriochlorophyllide A dehydrogenase